MALVAAKKITTKVHSETIFATKMLGKLMGSGIRIVNRGGPEKGRPIRALSRIPSPPWKT